MTTGITIASMMPVALIRICRSAKAMGPFGSSTPSVQPPSNEAPIRTKASKPYRMSDLVRAESDEAARTQGSAWQGLGMYPSAAAASLRGRGARERTTTVVNQQSRKQHEQV